MSAKFVYFLTPLLFGIITTGFDLRDYPVNIKYPADGICRDNYGAKYLVGETWIDYEECSLNECLTLGRVPSLPEYQNGFGYPSIFAQKRWTCPKLDQPEDENCHWGPTKEGRFPDCCVQEKFCIDISETSEEGSASGFSPDDEDDIPEISGDFDIFKYSLEDNTDDDNDIFKYNHEDSTDDDFEFVPHSQ